MRSLVFALDALAALRDATAAASAELTRAVALAELAGVHGLRLGVGEGLRPVSPADVQEVRRCAGRMELRMPAVQGLLKVALEARPDRVVLCAGGQEGPGSAGPIDLHGRDTSLSPLLRSLEEGGIPVTALVAPNLDSVKSAHGLGVVGVEFFTGATVDLPPPERRRQLEALGDAVRLAAKLRLEVGIGGGLDYGNLSEVLNVAPAAERVVVGRSLVRRSLLIGLDRAVRDLRSGMD